jgi:hypothetical protein
MPWTEPKYLCRRPNCSCVTLFGILEKRKINHSWCKNTIVTHICLAALVTAARRLLHLGRALQYPPNLPESQNKNRSINTYILYINMSFLMGNSSTNLFTYLMSCKISCLYHVHKTNRYW